MSEIINKYVFYTLHERNVNWAGSPYVNLGLLKPPQHSPFWRYFISPPPRVLLPERAHNIVSVVYAYPPAEPEKCK